MDPFIIDVLRKADLKCFWVRSLNTAFLGFSDEKKPARDILLLDIILPAWGLTAKVRSGSKGGKVIRPWNGKPTLVLRVSLNYFFLPWLIDLFTRLCLKESIPHRESWRKLTDC